jgi:Ca-activated chloride channel family protein
VRRIVLLSDGIDESGRPAETIVAVASRASAAGVAVSTVGIGADYNEALMTRLADASFGNYHFLRETSELDRILAREYGELGANVARDVVAEVELPRGVSFVRANGVAASQSGSVVTVRYGGLYAGDERRAVLELRTAAGRPGAIGELKTRVRYVDRASERAVALSWKAMPLVATEDDRAVAALTNPTCLEEGVEVAAAVRHDEAKTAWEHGDVARANAIAEDNLRALREANAALASPEISAQIGEYEGHLGVFNSVSSTSVDGRMQVRDITVANRARQQRDGAGR